MGDNTHVSDVGRAVHKFPDLVWGGSLELLSERQNIDVELAYREVPVRRLDFSVNSESIGKLTPWWASQSF
jgi:hypothetical protein